MPITTGKPSSSMRLTRVERRVRSSIERSRECWNPRESCCPRRAAWMSIACCASPTNCESRPCYYGLPEGYRSADLLKKAAATALVSLKWPEKAKDSDPEEPDSIRVLEVRDHAPSTPAVLARSGVRFALYSGGIDRRADLIQGREACHRRRPRSRRRVARHDSHARRNLRCCGSLGQHRERQDR